MSGGIPVTIEETLSNFLVIPANWSADWAWGLPLIVLTVVIHVLGLGLIRKKIVQAHRPVTHGSRQTAMFAIVLGSTTLLVTVLHGMEASLWAVAYRFLNAVPDARSCMLYSLNAITSYGHTSVMLEPHWQLMGAMESLNGWLLFGLTTAFLFDVIQQFHQAESGRERRTP
jgi:hypothetical protein